LHQLMRAAAACSGSSTTAVATVRVLHPAAFVEQMLRIAAACVPVRVPRVLIGSNGSSAVATVRVLRPAAFLRQLLRSAAERAPVPRVLSGPATPPGTSSSSKPAGRRPVLTEAAFAGLSLEVKYTVFAAISATCGDAAPLIARQVDAMAYEVGLAFKLWDELEDKVAHCAARGAPPKGNKSGGWGLGH
jgi:hypothetical protein